MLISTLSKLLHELFGMQVLFSKKINKIVNFGIFSKKCTKKLRARGLEPPQANAYQDLNLARLPIPPRSRFGALGKIVILSFVL